MLWDARTRVLLRLEEERATCEERQGGDGRNHMVDERVNAM